MADIGDILTKMKQNHKGVCFNDLSKVYEHFFGSPGRSGSSHKVYRTPWQGDPRVNIQNSKGKAKPYQVRQVLQAIDRLEVQNEERT
jgi:hypothetical protein